MVRYALFFLIFSLGIRALPAQSPEFRQISDLQNLPCNEIYDLYFDELGYLWMGTEIGVFRYDGQDYKSMSSQKVGNQPLTGITAVKGRLFTFNFLGNIYEISGDSLIDIPVPDWVLTRNYALLSSGFDDELWVSTNNGIFSYNLDNGKWTVRNPKSMGPDDFAYSKSMRYHHGEIWYTTNKEVIQSKEKEIKQ